MPRYKLQGPDGRTVTIEAADRDTAIRGAQEWAAANPAPSRPVNAAEQRAMDYVRRTAEVSAMAAKPAPRVRPAPPRERTQREGEDYARRQVGSSGDIQQAIGSGALRALGAIGDMGQIARDPMRLVAPGRESQTEALDRMGAFYNPTTDEGKLAEGATMMAPNALFPGSAGARFAAWALPTLAGEASRIATREMGYDEQSQANMRGLGQFAGGLASGVRLGRPGPPRVKPERLSRQEEAALRRATRGVNPAEARARISDIQEYGGQPVLADAIGSRGQVRIRAAATRDIPEQQTAVDFQAARRVNAQDFAEGLGARISPETRSPQAAQEAIASARSGQAAVDYGPVNAQSVVITDEVRSALSGNAGKAALRRALSAAEDNRNTEQVMELEDLIAGRANSVSAGTLDRIRIAMAGRGGKLIQSPATRDNARGLFGRAGDIDNTLEQVPELAPARAAFRESIGQEEAVVAGGRLFAPGTRADVEAAARMSAEQRQAALAGARNAIEEAAGKPAGAAGVLDELATGSRVGRRLNAWGGPDVAADVQRGARVGRSMLDTARNVSPRIGSESNLNIEGSAALNGAGAVAESALAVKTGGLSAMFRPVVEMLKRARMSDADAGRMVQLALDPDPRKLELALQYLEGSSPTLARMVRAELGRIAARGAPVAALSAVAAAPSQAQARPGPPRR